MTTIEQWIEDAIVDWQEGRVEVEHVAYAAVHAAHAEGRAGSAFLLRCAEDASEPLLDPALTYTIRDTRGELLSEETFAVRGGQAGREWRCREHHDMAVAS